MAVAEGSPLLRRTFEAVRTKVGREGAGSLGRVRAVRWHMSVPDDMDVSVDDLVSIANDWFGGEPTALAPPIDHERYALRYLRWPCGGSAILSTCGGVRLTGSLVIVCIRGMATFEHRGLELAEPAP